MTDWAFNLSFSLTTYAALVRAFGYGEAYGRNLEGYLAKKWEAEDQENSYARYEKASEEERAAYDAAEAKDWEDFHAENWTPGCGRKVDTVTCKLCSTDYKPIGGGTNQGSGCCAWITERRGNRVLHGGYGSVMADLTEFVVTPEGYDRLPVGLDPICDSCIKRMISNGILLEERELNLEYD